MGVDQPECGAGRASPVKWPNTNTGGKKKRKGRSSGCRLQVGGAENGLLAIRLQNPMALFSVAVLQLQPAICSERISAVRMDLIGLLGQMYHHAVWLSDLLSAKAGKS